MRLKASLSLFVVAEALQLNLHYDCGAHTIKAVDVK